MIRGLALIALVVGLLGCGDDETTPDVPQETAGAERGPDSGRCVTEGEGRETSEFDTNGDTYPDVRKVYLVVGTPPRRVLICREVDVNGDGSKDVYRFYTDEGVALREESDRNFDGGVDQVVYFEENVVIRSALDENGDGLTDYIRFYEDGQLARAEQDSAARSTQPIGHDGPYTDDWQPDRFEYYREGQAHRIGFDLDGDGFVDRWDRDEVLQQRLEEAQRQREAAADAAGNE